MTYKFTIGWLYPQLMSTYGDRGNILVLQKRSAWRGIKTEIMSIDQNTSAKEIAQVDLLFGGGAQDREQEIVMRNLLKKKAAIKELVEKDKPALFVCGAPQLMGNYYEPGEGERIEGLGIFDMYSKHPGPHQERLIGNVVAKVHTENLSTLYSPFPILTTLVGFENHGGRTYLGERAKPFAKVLKGFGNNGEDGTEGVVYKNAIGSYLHGPLLPKNPEIADWLINTALQVKYKKEIQLNPLDDMLEENAKDAIIQKLKLQ
ncbi:MAG: type 1 glutamine amidotransferase [Candidatus Levyibacteriota bacterium]